MTGEQELEKLRRELKLSPAQRLEAYYSELRARQQQLGTQAQTDVPHRLQKLGVPADCILASRNPADTRAMDAARRYLAAPPGLVRTLVLVGPHGTGKSTAAAFVLGDAVKQWDWNGQPSGGKQRPPMAWCHAAELTSETDFGKVNPDWLDGLRHCRLLILDDLGKDGTAAGLVALRDLLVARHEAQRRTVLTSNMAPTDFGVRYGESWLERLKVAALVPDLRAEKSLRKRVRT